MQTESYAAAGRPRRRAPYWVVTITETEAGFLVHETRGDERRLAAMIVDEDEARDYFEHRVKKPWRIAG